MNEAPAFEALVVAEDESMAAPLESVLRDEGATVHRAETVEAAVAIAAHARIDVAFVEVPAGLALCHHLPGVAAGVEIHAVVRPTDLERGAEALSLGVQGVLVAPVTGDAVVRAVEAQRTRRGEAASRAALVAELEAARRRLAAYDAMPSVTPSDASPGAASKAAFRDVATRLLSLSARHGRRASVVAVHFVGGDRTARRDRALARIADVVRESDALATEEGDLVLFLPESGGLGAHACRRRVLARLRGERRARPAPSASSPRLDSGPRSRPGAGLLEPGLEAGPVSAGVATFPHDGPSLEHLLRTARRRAAEDARSAVHELALDALSLPEIVDELLARPILDAGPCSPYPLDLAAGALLGIVTRACRDALRTGHASVVTTERDGLGAKTAARTVTAPRVLDVRSVPGCADLEAVVVESEQGSWVCCGRTGDERFRGVHAADPLLADLLVQRLSAVGSPA